MTPQQFDHIQKIFLRIQSAAEEDRERILADEDESVRGEVQSLLAAHESCGTFLERDGLGQQDDPTSLAHDKTEHHSTKKVGNYRLLQQIGEGGHGTVFMAEQTAPIQRKVAVKLIKPGMDSKQVLARFHAEQQALAMMDHPSIARVIDAGTTETGSPYFVMELVKGVPIHEFCDQNKLSLRERLEIFLQVCNAVHHAHQKGVIHRDLKPSNILVAMGEGEPLAKVIDFGIAKALDTRLTQQTLFTEYGQMIGTLEYMSPEQAEMSAVDIDTRSDVYSLGVVFYQLLTGETPLSKDELLKQGVFEIPRMIRETDPETPSSRVTSKHRQVSRVDRDDNATGIGELSRGDLDWVAMKALAKDRRRRYESALDFARDVARYLAGEPVEAHPPSILYKAGKFARRYRVAAVTGTLVASSLLIGVLGLATGLHRARKDRDTAVLAQKESDRSKRQLAENMYSELLESAWRAAKLHDNERSRRLLYACLPDMRGWEWDFAKSQIRDQSHISLRKVGESAVGSIDFCKSTNQFACVLENGKVEIWNALRGEKSHIVEGPFQANAARFSLDGQLLVVGTSKSELISFRTSDYQREASRSLGLGGIYDIAISPADEQVAVCTGGGWVETMQLRSLQSVGKWKLPSRMSSVSFLEETDQLLATGIDGNAYVLRSGDEEYTDGFVSEASLLACQQLGAGKYAIMSAGRVLSVDVQRPDSPPEEIISCESGLTSLAIDNRGEIFAGCGDGSLVTGDVVTEDQAKTPRTVANFGSAIAALSATAIDQQFLVGLSDGRLLAVEINEVQDGWVATSKTASTAGLLLPKTGIGVAFDENGWMRSYDLASGELQKEEQAHSSSIWSVSADTQEQVLATVGEDQHLRCWELPEFKLRFEVPIDWGVRDVCVAPDGTWIAAAPPISEKLGQREGEIAIWDANTGTPQKTLSGHDNWVLKMIASPDGTHLVSASENRETRIWDLATGEAARIISPPHRSAAERLALSPSGSTLYLGHRDGWVTSWRFPDATPGPVWSAFGDALTGFEVLEENRLLATSRSNASLRIRDFKSQSNVAEFDLGVGYVSNFQLARDRKFVSVAGPDRRPVIVTVGGWTE